MNPATPAAGPVPVTGTSLTPARGARRLEHVVGRILSLGMLLGMALVLAGVVEMAARGTSSLSAGPRLDLARLPGDVAAFRPEGLIWLGLLVVIATPSARVAASLLGFAAARDRRMAAVAGAVLVVIALGVLAGGRS